MKEHLGELIVGIILLFVGAGISYFVFRPAPLAFARCEPLRGDTPLNVRCDNESNYHRHVIWDFGDQGIQQIKDQDVVEHQYSNSGRYTISLTAHGQGTPGKWTQNIEVVTPATVNSPIGVTVIARTKENQIVKTKAVQVSKTKDNHPSTFSGHSQTYTDTFIADPGFKIVDANFQSSSAARADDITPRISADGSEIQFSYRLTSGPAVDRYRGWLRGDLVLKQEQILPAHNVTLGSDITIMKYGTYALEASVTLDSMENVSILGENGQTLAFGSPNGVLVSQQSDLVFSFQESGGQLFLKVEPKN